jgi:hypothetical protein
VAVTSAELAWVQGTTEFVHPPPDDFVPLNRRDELAKYGLPPEPNPIAQPMSHAFWKRLLTPSENGGLRFTPQSAECSPLMDDCALSRARRIGGSTRHERSHNWSGAYVTPKNGRSFTSVHGAWTLSQPKKPIEIRQAQQYRSSTWVGLDGQREYLNASLPQIGTSQVVDDATGGVRIEVWWQWWCRGLQMPIMQIKLQVEPGDEVMAQVEAILPQDGRRPTSARFIVKNHSKGEISAPILAQAPRVPLTVDREMVQLEISGATAEWIVEAPTRTHRNDSHDSDMRYELPNYGMACFDYCLAVSPGWEQDLTGAKLIDMVAVRADQHRTEIVSFAEIASSQSFRTTYR